MRLRGLGIGLAVADLAGACAATEHGSSEPGGSPEATPPSNIEGYAASGRGFARATPRGSPAGAVRRERT